MITVLGLQTEKLRHRAFKRLAPSLPATKRWGQDLNPHPSVHMPRVPRHPTGGSQPRSKRVTGSVSTPAPGDSGPVRGSECVGLGVVLPSRLRGDASAQPGEGCCTAQQVSPPRGPRPPRALAACRPPNADSGRSAAARGSAPLLGSQETPMLLARGARFRTPCPRQIPPRWQKPCLCVHSFSKHLLSPTMCPALC